MKNKKESKETKELEKNQGEPWNYKKNKGKIIGEPKRNQGRAEE